VEQAVPVMQMVPVMVLPTQVSELTQFPFPVIEPDFSRHLVPVRLTLVPVWRLAQLA